MSRQLELAAEWDELVGVEAQLAAALRFFVITRDPHDWGYLTGALRGRRRMGGRRQRSPRASLVRRLSDVEHRLAATRRDIAAALGLLCETALLGAIRRQGVILAGAYFTLSLPSARRSRFSSRKTASDGGSVIRP